MVCTALTAKKSDDPDDHLIATFLKGDGTRFEEHGIVHVHITHRKRGLRVEWQGVRIRVFWPAEEAWYDGTVRRTARQQDASIFFIAYDDGTSEWRDLGETQWTCLPSTIVVADADTLVRLNDLRRSTCIRGSSSTPVPPRSMIGGERTEWRWMHPRAASDKQRRLSAFAETEALELNVELAEAAMLKAERQAQVRRRVVANTLRHYRLWDPHAMHTLSGALPYLHRMPSRTLHEPAPPTFARVFVDVPSVIERGTLTHIIDQDCANTLQLLADAASSNVATLDAFLFGGGYPLAEGFSSQVTTYNTLKAAALVAARRARAAWQAAEPEPSRINAAQFVLGARPQASRARHNRVLNLYRPHARFFVEAEAALPASEAGEPRADDYCRVLPDELVQLRELALGNVTTFTTTEAANPINFYEQARRCYHCGRQLFTIFTSCTCHDGELIHDDILPTAALELLTREGGISKESRALNELVRMCSLALPKGTVRYAQHTASSSKSRRSRSRAVSAELTCALPLACRMDHVNGGNLRITGIPYRLVDHLNEGHNVRSFLYDPMRVADAERYAAGFQPTPRMIAAAHELMLGNEYWTSLVAWAGDVPMATARFVLRWPGTSPAVRAFTYLPSAGVPGPRTIYVTWADGDQVCRVRSDDPRYAMLSWPLLFPTGRVLRRRPFGCAPAAWPARTEWEPFEAIPLSEDDGAFVPSLYAFSAATLAVAYQPERRRAIGRGQGGNVRPPSYVMVDTVSPYDAGVFVKRPFSRVELAGRLGEEYILDRWLCRVDMRRWVLHGMQRHLRGYILTAAERIELETLEDAEYDAAQGDGRRADRATRLPNSEAGTPAHHQKMATKALYVVHCTHRPVLFVTQTLNPSCAEIATRLACFDEESGSKRVQQPYDRPALHCDTFQGKHLALRAALRSGTIFRNLGRPVRDESRPTLRLCRIPNVLATGWRSSTTGFRSRPRAAGISSAHVRTSGVDTSTSITCGALERSRRSGPPTCNTASQLRGQTTSRALVCQIVRSSRNSSSCSSAQRHASCRASHVRPRTWMRASSLVCH